MVMTDRRHEKKMDQWALFKAAGLAMPRSEALDQNGNPMAEGVVVDRAVTTPTGEVVEFKAVPLVVDCGETVVFAPVDSRVSAKLMPTPAKNGTVFRAF